MISYYNTSEEVKNSGVDMAIIPLGSIEQHGRHLPIGTDYFVADAISETLGDEINALVYPAIPFSNCYEHKGSSGTLGFKPQTLINMIEDLVMGLYSQGFKKIVILMAHGGIFSVPPMVRQLNALNDGLQVVCTYTGLKTEKISEIIENNDEIHAGERETSLMMYIKPESVKKEKIPGTDFVPDYPQPFLNFAPLTSLSKTGVWGCPSYATEEKGEILFSEIVEAITQYIEKAFQICKKEAW